MIGRQMRCHYLTARTTKCSSAELFRVRCCSTRFKVATDRTAWNASEAGRPGVAEQKTLESALVVLMRYTRRLLGVAVDVFSRAVEVWVEILLKQQLKQDRTESVLIQRASAWLRSYSRQLCIMTALETAASNEYTTR